MEHLDRRCGAASIRAVRDHAGIQLHACQPELCAVCHALSQCVQA